MIAALSSVFAINRRTNENVYWRLWWFELADDDADIIYNQAPQLLYLKLYLHDLCDLYASDIYEIYNHSHQLVCLYL